MTAKTRVERKREETRKINAIRGYKEIEYDIDEEEDKKVSKKVEKDFEDIDYEEGSKLKKIIMYIILLIALIVIYSIYIEPKLLFTIHEYGIETNKIDDKMDGLKIVHFSDIHYGTTINKDELDRVIKKINKIKPDIILFTGDLFDKNIILHKDSIKDILLHNTRYFDVMLFQGEKGTEESFKSFSGSSASIIHIATHGFNIHPPRENMRWYDYYVYCMEHTGLLLSGALDKYDNKDVLRTEDGFLRSSEISTLDLSKTDLLVLSACKSGLSGQTPIGNAGLPKVNIPGKRLTAFNPSLKMCKNMSIGRTNVSATSPTMTPMITSGKMTRPNSGKTIRLTATLKKCHS